MLGMSLRIRAGETSVSDMCGSAVYPASMPVAITAYACTAYALLPRDCCPKNSLRILCFTLTLYALLPLVLARAGGVGGNSSSHGRQVHTRHSRSNQELAGGPCSDFFVRLGVSCPFSTRVVLHTLLDRIIDALICVLMGLWKNTLCLKRTMVPCAKHRRILVI
jgi:hypothetical protein